MICEFCNQDKWIPAGTSKKTGKPYNAFCGNMDCPSNQLKPRKGYTREMVSTTPTVHNDFKSETMLMSYAKDIVVAMLARDQLIGAPGKEVIVLYREFLQEIKNPNSVKIE